MRRHRRREGARALSAPLLFCGVLGCLRPQTSSPGKTPIKLPPLSVVSTPEPFPPQALVYDFTGDLAVAHADRPLLTTLTVDELAPASDDQAVPGAPDPWTTPVLSVGRGGAAYLLASDGSFYTLDLNDLGATLLGRVPAGAQLTAFAARRDADGVLWADGAGAIHRVGGDGHEDLVIPAHAGEAVEALSSSVDGHVYWVASGGGACTGARSYPDTGAASAAALDLGAPPCLAQLSHDSQTLWVAGQTATGAKVLGLRPSDLHARAPASSVDGIAPQRLALSNDGRFLALLGAGPKDSVAYAFTAHLLGTETVPETGVWRLLTTQLVPQATDGLFDDQGTLYLADPANKRVETVR